MDNKKHSTIRDKLEKKIHSGDLKMKPKSYFVLKGLLYVMGTLLVIGATLYLASFVFFVLRANGFEYLPHFGFRGFGIFFTSLPWLLVIFVVLLVVVLELLARHYSFVYRWPLLYSVLGIVILIYASSTLVARTPLHRSFATQASEKRLPIAGPMYQRYSLMRFRDAHIGTVVEVNPHNYILSDRSEVIYTVVTSTVTHFPGGMDIQKDEILMVIGPVEDDVIQAQGIRKIDGDRIPVFHGVRMKHRMPAR